jgi:hypothetical protein
VETPLSHCRLRIVSNVLANVTTEKHTKVEMLELGQAVQVPYFKQVVLPQIQISERFPVEQISKQ